MSFFRRRSPESSLTSDMQSAARHLVRDAPEYEGLVNHVVLTADGA